MTRPWRWIINGKLPLVLLPVRLETRFHSRTLKIRVFPDAVHIDSHEPGLTEREWHAARAYWAEPSVSAAAWQRLTAAFGVERAAYVARVTHPGAPGAPPRREAAWTRPVIARCLPARWYAVGQLDLDIVCAQGAPIPADLPVGPGPSHEEAPAWLASFDEAVAVGMALTLELDERMARDGLDRLLVYGVDERGDAARSTRELMDLFTAHHATAGLSYLSPGTATNNTEVDDSGYDRHSAAYAAAHRVELAPRPEPGPGSSAAVLQRAIAGSLAVSSDGLRLARGGDDRREDTVDALHRALWAGTWGYYLGQLVNGSEELRPDELTSESSTRPHRTLAACLAIQGRDFARIHVARHLRPGGPLSALRVGDQPYGVLPVISLDAWKPSGFFDRATAMFVPMLRGLRDQVWLPAARGHADRIDARSARSVEQANELLLRILCTSAVGQSLYAIEHAAEEVLHHLQRRGEPIPADWRIRGRDPELLRLLASLGVPTPIRPMIAIGAAVPIADLLVDPATPAALRDLAEQGWKALRANQRSTTVLHRLVRHSALREYVDAATRIQLRLSLLARAEHLDPTVVLGEPDWGPRTFYTQLLTTKLPAGSARWPTLGEYLDGKDIFGNPLARDPHDPDHLGEFRAAVRTLADRPLPELDLALRQFLDASSHRLDAWLTSIANRRLDELRRAGVQGALVGGFGWVEDLRPRPVAGARSRGFLHAPSLPQAVTAGVLASGYLAHAGGAANPFAAWLSSDRVRLASWLLDGVRRGQSLSALTGYLFERRLHEVGASALLEDFRARARLEAVQLGADGGAAAVATAPVVDGLVLRRRHRDGELQAWLTGLTGALRDAALDALHVLDAAVDATADALIAESVHHVVSGAPARAAVALDASTYGDGPFPELTFLHTPRTGIDVSHRVVILVPPAEPTGWHAGALRRPFALAAPVLHAIVERMLPAPDQIRFEVDWGAGVATVALAECEVSAVDCLQASAVSEPAIPAVVRLAAIDAARGRLHLTVPITGFAVRPMAGDALSIRELLAAATAVRALLRGARPAIARDLETPGAPAGESTNGGLAGAADVLASQLASLAGIVANGPLDEAALRIASALGIPLAAEAILQPAPAHAASIAAEVAQRLAAVAEARRAAPGLARDRAIAHAVLGAQLPLPVAFRAGEPERLARAVARGTQQTDAAERRTFLQRAARVRPGIAALQRALLAARATGAKQRAELDVLQLPDEDGAPWAGGPLGGAALSGPRLSIACLWPGLPAPRAPMAGLVIDEWTETIPGSSATTGVAFHFDGPASQAPQTMLIAVPADASAVAWDPEVLETTLREAIELAKIRAVTPETLSRIPAKLDEILPALMFAFHPEDAVPSTDFHAPGGV